ncbi:ChrR family anti-sigma-E factor [Pseudemcibacter aquimaris]|uniref:ChrR family anti-sigma-E factor n=1 Tax=Pseudemcibacter aquimaris TaxID=2857064 RepID=UPI0020112DD8|nr:ChrR family anti-sigma-E factor [Pseudemcibacter aquimaris]MCC3861176.1 ChrR family anti-sigma-E factor [Pseudemcibacter aquimaris]WDU57951.1 ChrR family anti-sigma-E factor [Pseudemcibacter aquimaris]
MKTNGIISDDWIVSYASGALSEAHALVVASHCSYHPTLQQKILDAENIGGMFMENCEPADISNDLFDNLMDRIDEEHQVSETENSDSNLPTPLADYIGKPLDELKWRTMGPGLSQVRLWTGPNDERLWLLKAKGGAKIPTHDHNGLELTLVLQGSYHIDEQCYRPGMIEIADEDTKNHTPIIDDGEDCICLVVTEAPIKIHSLIGRMVQPFIGL